MKKNQKYKIINIEDKTRLKLSFIKNFYIQHFGEFDSKKQKIIDRELEIVERLLNNEPVNGSEYQSVMSMVNETIGNENMFNNYIKRLRNERLLNNEPVNGSEYQSVMSMINETIGNEDMFNNYIKRLRNER